ncbi:hypothetical protein RN001_006041 [Aquatica leii]|uniref:DUF7869 domain-containing protein n=1 Tax=Aquatica leii TaxID=1421715 RepID=A0AAN7SID9_9COLE|nr:hypothetical protein RN001_006041 [Aquatica leii]
MYLCRYMSVSLAKRRRKNKEMKQRDATVCYTLNSNKKLVRVCKKFFSAVFDVTKHRLVTVIKVLQEGGVPKERRGGDTVSHKTAPKTLKVRQFIGKLRGKESHYNRKKSKRIYLSATLSVAKLHKMYNRGCDREDQVSYDMFRSVFLNDFNIGFSSPASDVCSKCTRLREQVKHTKDKKGKNTFYELNKEKPNNSITFCFDLQQVQPLPRTPIGDAFYSHQITWYAFCCVSMSSRHPTFYVWTEDLAGRGATQIGSALLQHLKNLNYKDINLIRLFCDGCGEQNKNSHIIHTLMYWLKNKAPENVVEIIITFPVRGHSFLPADRSFGRVEKILNKNPVITCKEKYVEIYSEVGSIKSLGTDWQMYDIKELEKVYKKIKGISECKRIGLKKFMNKKMKLLLNMQLSRLPLGNSIPDKKKLSLSHLMKQHFGEEWQCRQNLLWYKNLLVGVEKTTENGLENNNTQEVADGICDCLHEEAAIHI